MRLSLAASSGYPAFEILANVQLQLDFNIDTSW